MFLLKFFFWQIMKGFLLKSAKKARKKGKIRLLFTLNYRLDKEQSLNNFCGLKMYEKNQICSKQKVNNDIQIFGKEYES